MVSFSGSVVAWQAAPDAFAASRGERRSRRDRGPDLLVVGVAPDVPDWTATWPLPAYVASTTLVPVPADFFNSPLLVSRLSG